MVLFNADGHAEGLLKNLDAISRAGAPVQAPPKVMPPPSLDPASTPSNDLCKNLSPDERMKIVSCQDK
jgi:hypothetical protein